MSKIPSFLDTLINQFKNLQVTESSQREEGPSILRHLESSLWKYSTVCRDIENVAITFSVLMGSSTGSDVQALRVAADSAFDQIKASENFANNKQKAYTLYNNVFHAMAKIIKTGYNEEENINAYFEAERHLKNLQSLNGS